MKIKEVQNAKDVKEFIKLPYLIYKNDSRWIPHIESDVEGIFDPNLNPAYREGEAIRWILQNEQGKTIGRVAAFINYKALEGMDYPCGSMGFFECINDKTAAKILLDTCRHWLEGKGMKAMEGPENFGERDKYWGLLIECREAQPSYLENYNPEYYQSMFEEYGFQSYFRQHTYAIDVNVFQPERLKKISDWVMSKPEIKLEYLDPNNLDKYLHDFVEIYNQAWVKFENFKPVTYEEVRDIFKQLKPILIPEFLYYAYVDGKPAGFFLMLQDANQIFQYVNGKLDLWGKLKFLYYKKFRPVNKIKGLVFGIAPGYQNLGLDAAFLSHIYEQLKNFKQFSRVEVAWVGDFNTKMESLMIKLGATISKVHITYRKLFDESIEFKPYKLKE